MTGDDLTPNATGLVTHAITIDAPHAEVWPWILQIGQDRGGFYSYAFLENLIGCEIHNCEHIVAEWQNRDVGDTVWFGMPKHIKGQARMVAAILVARRSMVLATLPGCERIQAGEQGRAGTWAFVLVPRGQQEHASLRFTRPDAGSGVLHLTDHPKFLP